MTLTASQAASPSIAFRVRLEFLADDGVWCDMNKDVPSHPNDPGYKRLLEKPKLVIKAAREARVFSTEPWSATVENTDRFWDKTKTVTLYDDSGIPHTLDSLHRTKARVRLQNRTESGWTVEPMGTYLLDKIETAHRDSTARIRFVGLQKLLMDAEAQTVKNGGSWYEAVPIGYLVEKLVKKGLGAEAEFVADWPPAIFSGETPTATQRMNYLTRPGVPRDNGQFDFTDRFIPTAIAQDEEDSDTLWVGGGELIGSASVGFRGQLWNMTKSTGRYFLEHSFAFSQEDTVIAQIHDTNNGYLWIWTVKYRNVSGSDNGYAFANHNATLWRFTKSSGAMESVTDYPMWTCTDNYRWPDRSLGMRGLGHIDRTDVGGSIVRFGENISCPVWSQMMHYKFGESPPYFSVETTDYAAQDHDSIFTMDSQGLADVSLSSNVHRETGWRPMATIDDAPDRMVRFCMWPYIKASEVSNVTDMYWIYYKESTDQWILVSIDLSTSVPGAPVINEVVLAFTTGGSYVVFDKLFSQQITAWCLSADFVSSGSVFVATTQWIDEIGQQYSNGKGYKFDATSGSEDAELWDLDGSVAGERYSVVYLRSDVNLGAGQNTLAGTAFDRTTGKYGVFYANQSTGIEVAFSTSDERDYFPVSGAPIIGWEWNSTDSVYTFMDCSTGALWQMTITSGSPGSGCVILPDTTRGTQETYLCMPNLVRDSSGYFYGVTGPYPPVWPYPWNLFLEPSHAGQWRLFERSGRRALVVSVADFTDMSCWEAIEHMAEIAGRYVVGFNLSGQFFFRSRDGGASSPIVLIPRGSGFADHNSDQLYISDVRKFVEYEDLITVAEVTPYRPELKEPEATIEKTPSSLVSQSLGTTVQQLDRGSKRVVLKCVSSGTVGIASPDTNNPETPSDSQLLFSFAYGVEEIYTELSVDTNGISTQVNVTNLVQRHSDEAGTGIGGAITPWYIGATRVREGDRIIVGDGPELIISSISGGVIHTSAAIYPSVNTVPEGTLVQIYPKWNRESVYSEDGITTLSTSFTSGATIMPVESIENLRVGMVVGLGSEKLRIDKVNRSTTNCNVTRAIFGTTAASYSIDVPVQAYINPTTPGRWYEIGGTGLAIGFFPEGTIPTEERRFVVGDRIPITCEGVRMVKSKHSIFVTESLQSIKRYGRKESRRDNNPFIDEINAEVISETLVDLWGDPYSVVQGPIEGLPAFDIGDQIVLRAASLFPDEAAGDFGLFMERLQIDLARIEFDIQARTISKLTTGGDKAKEWGGEVGGV